MLTMFALSDSNDDLTDIWFENGRNWPDTEPYNTYEMKPFICATPLEKEEIVWKSVKNFVTNNSTLDREGTWWLIESMNSNIDSVSRSRVRRIREIRNWVKYWSEIMEKPILVEREHIDVNVSIS